MAVGESSAYALLEDGTVVAWGANDEGQLGNGRMGAGGELGIYPKPSITPVRVTGLTDIIQIEAGRKHAVALRKDGSVWAWGTRDDGAIGDGKPATLRPLRAIGPTRVEGLEGVTRIAVGRSRNLALKADGHVMAWGANSQGELGIGTRLTQWTPAQIVGLDRVVEIAAGSGSMGYGVSGPSASTARSGSGARASSKTAPASWARTCVRPPGWTCPDVCQRPQRPRQARRAFAGIRGQCPID